jgi:hypothetical protein
MKKVSIFRPKPDVSPWVLADRLEGLLYQIQRGIANKVESMNRTGFGEVIYKALRYKTDGIVAFGMYLAIKTILDGQKAEAVLKDCMMLRLDRAIEVYAKRFEDLRYARSPLARAGAEYLLAGIAFGEACGSTGNQEVDDFIRKFGAETFANVFKVTKKELTSVRLITDA